MSTKPVYSVKSLPDKANLEFLKKEAKRFFRRFQDNDQAALIEVKTHFTSPESFKSLRDAQLLVARSYGFQGWKELCAAVEAREFERLSDEELAMRFVDYACISYTGQDSDRRYKKAERMLVQYPELKNYNLVTALISHNVEYVHSKIIAQPELAHQVYPPRGWPLLLYLTYSRVPDASVRKTAVNLAILLLDYGADVNARFTREHTYKFTALTGAIGEGEGGVINQPPHQHARELAKVLLEYGANPNDSQGLYNSMFTDSGDYWLRTLVSFGLNKNDTVNWDDSLDARTMFNYLLETAIGRDHLDRARYLLSLGADPNAHCHYADRSIYAQALVSGKQDFIRLFESAGANSAELNPTDKFLIAVNHTALSDIESLVQAHPKLLENPDLLANASVPVLEHLAKAGFNPNQQNANGKTALHVLATKGKLDGIQYLLAQGADPDIRDSFYQGKPVSHAHFNGQFEVRDYLLNRFDYPLESAACGHYASLKRVLDKDRSQANTRGVMGNTPLHVVCNWLSGEIDIRLRRSIIKLLLDHGADLHAKNDEGLTPLELNEKILDDDNVFLLKEYS